MRLARRFAFVLAWIATTAIAPALAGAASPDSSATPLAVVLGPGSVLWLEGTSTLHPFESRSSDVAIELRRDPGAKDPADVAGLIGLIRASGVRGVAVRVPVATLRSEKSGLDKNLRKAMKAEKYPDVRFALTQYAPATPASATDTIAIDAKGTLTITDHEHPIALSARAYPAAQGVWLEGSESLLMSEYGIPPPTLMLGAIRVGDRITVKYRLLLVPKGESANASSR